MFTHHQIEKLQKFLLDKFSFVFPELNFKWRVASCILCSVIAHHIMRLTTIDNSLIHQIQAVHHGQYFEPNGGIKISSLVPIVIMKDDQYLHHFFLEYIYTIRQILNFHYQKEQKKVIVILFSKFTTLQGFSIKAMSHFYSLVSCQYLIENLVIIGRLKHQIASADIKKKQTLKQFSVTLNLQVWRVVDVDIQYIHFFLQLIKYLSAHLQHCIILAQT
ncbi:unnamed protein product [Paramecium octaurelia]|uniref:Uncharacterized protein n=1 Tax=Paramecium octaurelia TaxID=43137 RepID=A0A8S1WQL4_PAROT|nr:unnamed protein product [Paramecium octaurelia]